MLHIPCPKYTRCAGLIPVDAAKPIQHHCTELYACAYEWNDCSLNLLAPRNDESLMNSLFDTNTVSVGFLCACMPEDSPGSSNCQYSRALR
jgi:hypothetical protein